MNNNIKGLLGNIGIFTIANFATKFLNFLVLPLYTSFLTTEEYGTIDLVTTLIQLLFPIFTLAVCDAVMRFGISEKEDINQVFRIGIRRVNYGIIPMLFACGIYGALSKQMILGFFLFGIYVVVGYNTFFANFAKAINKTKEMAIITTFISAITMGCNVVFVAGLKMGVNGYLSSVFIGNTIGIVLYIGLCNIKKFYTIDKPLSKTLHKSMIMYSIPLIPNAVFWWINSSLDRWTLTFISGVSVVGLYAVANKLPTILSSVSTIFSQAWNLSLFQSEKNDRKKFFETTFDVFKDVMLCCSLGIIMLCKMYARYGFTGDFFSAWKLVPILTVGVFFSALNSIIGSLFTANKDTRLIFTTTLVGSIINCFLNIPFCYFWGAFGAAIATSLSYFVVFLIRIIRVRRLYGITIQMVKTLVNVILLLVVCVLAVLDNLWITVWLITLMYCLYFLASLYSKYKNVKKKAMLNS